MEQYAVIFALVCAVAAVAYGLFSAQWILGLPQGNDRMKQIADAPLVHTASGTITVFSVASALLVVVVSYILGRLASRAVMRMLARREVAHGARFALVLPRVRARRA